MRIPLRAAACLIALAVSCMAHAPTSAAAISDQLKQLALDPDETYRVRDVHLRRGDVSIYLNDGVLSLAVPVAGRSVAAVFTTENVEAGDAEILIMPAIPAERASLAAFTNRPNLDEHFTSAVFFFSDETAKEIRDQIAQGPITREEEAAKKLAVTMNPILQNIGSTVAVQTLESLLDDHESQNGFFFASMFSRQLGAFDFLYQPDTAEPVTVGSVSKNKDNTASFKLWTGYRPRHAPPFVRPPPSISEYRLATTIQPDLTMSVNADFNFSPQPDSGRVLNLSISRRLHIDSASVDGKPVEIYQNFRPDFSGVDSDSQFLLVCSDPLTSGKQHRVHVEYSGSVIRQVSAASYFVSERNLWYPHREPMLTTFDLTFRCPEQFQLVATGEPVENRIENGIRMVHRKTSTPAELAGFNFGQYVSNEADSGPYRVECYADASTASGMAGIASETQGILDEYTKTWIQLPIHTLAVTPIPGYFGQGFPGLIYLSNVAYLREETRPPELRGPRLTTFFSQIVLPHEIAHQWWGNLVNGGDYRTEWLTEAMANYSAVQFVERKSGSAAIVPILEQFRNDLASSIDGKRVETYGPVDFGFRLLENSDIRIWHAIVYEKGTWILHMLRKRLGDEAFRKMQLTLLRDYSDKPISNEDFRQVLSSFVPQGQPDRDLTTFFDTWVYGTGIPKLRLSRAGQEFQVQVSGVDDAFTADLPVRCKLRAGGERTAWLRIVFGANLVPASRSFASCELPTKSEYLYDPE